MELKLLLAYIAAGTSLITVLVNVLLTRNSERARRNHERLMNALKERQEKELIELKTGFDKEIKVWEAQINEAGAERNARRDYEYEARKRVYGQVEPVLFQLGELSEAALHRIYSLARTARHGNLPNAPTSWLGDSSEHNYYYHSTLYHLMAPLAAIKLLQRRITVVDLTVEKSIAAQYALAKRLLITFTDDFEFARFDPKLAYDPNADELDRDAGKELLQLEPAKYWRQGVFIGWLENCAEAMLTVETPNCPARVMSFGEMETSRAVPDSTTNLALRRIRYLLLRFHPAGRPVLWRILVAQTCIYRAFLSIREQKLRGAQAPERPLIILDVDRELLDWRSKPDEASAETVFQVPFATARRYFQKYIPTLLAPETGASQEPVSSEGTNR